MNIDVEGVPVRVPACWPKYTDSQKAAVATMVHRLRVQHGNRLIKVYVDRIVRAKVGQARTVWPWRIDGGYCTK
jgi:hypothetical protein